MPVFARARVKISAFCAFAKGTCLNEWPLFSSGLVPFWGKGASTQAANISRACVQASRGRALGKQKEESAPLMFHRKNPVKQSGLSIKFISAAAHREPIGPGYSRHSRTCSQGCADGVGDATCAGPPAMGIFRRRSPGTAVTAGELAN